MTRCLNQAREKLTSLKAAFAPIQDKAVPERLTLQTRIQRYGSLVASLQDQLADFQEANAVSPSALSPSPGFAPKRGGGLGLLLPLGAMLLLAGGGVAFWLSKKSEPAASLNASLTASDSAAAPHGTVVGAGAASAAPTVSAAASPPFVLPGKPLHKPKPLAHPKPAPKH